MMSFTSRQPYLAWPLLVLSLVGCTRTTQGSFTDDEDVAEGAGGLIGSSDEGSGGRLINPYGSGGDAASDGGSGGGDAGSGSTDGAGGWEGIGGVAEFGGGAGGMGNGSGGRSNSGGSKGSGGTGVGGSASGGSDGGTVVTCDLDEYRTGGPTVEEGGACAPLTVCALGQFEVTPPTATSDRICSATPECDPEDTISCSENGAKGNCASGVQVCDADGQWTQCTILPQASDSCTPGDDANCNGTYTEGCGCLTGNTRSCGADGAQGSCAYGQQTCTSGGIWGACTIQPAANDSCAIAGDDSNCDATPNGGCTCTNGQQSVCGPSIETGTCKKGLSTCTSNAYGTCVGAVYPIGRDCTSPLDNDCSGSPDNTIDSQCQCAAGAIQDCQSHAGLDGNGPCQAGSRTCLSSVDKSTTFWSPCTGSVGPDGPDSCSVVDDDSDCDGTPNSGCDCIAGESETCDVLYSSDGICGSESLVCDSLGQWPDESDCDAIATLEACGDSLDNDCDGTVNEVASCPCTAAPCQNAGVCSQANGAYSCDCSGTGFIGEDCELSVAFTLTPPFVGEPCEAADISADGSVVAATCSDGTNSLPYYWSRDSGWVALELPDGSTAGRVVAMSDNGQVFAGVVDGVVDTAVRWTAPGATPDLLPSIGATMVYAMSGDGQFVTGADVTLLVWDADDNSSIYSAPTENLTAELSAIDADGSLIVGGNGAMGIVSWTSSTPSWIDLPGEVLNTRAVSGDGSVVIGSGSDPDDATKQILWTYEADTLTWLDDLGGGTGSICEAFGADTSGTVIVGHCDDTPAVWVGGVGSTLIELIAAQNGDDLVALAGQAKAVSADGSTVVGDDGTEIFLVILP